MHFLHWKWISIKNSLKFVPKSPVYYIPALVQVMAWRRLGDKPFLNRWWVVYRQIYALLGLNVLLKYSFIAYCLQIFASQDMIESSAFNNTSWHVSSFNPFLTYMQCRRWAQHSITGPCFISYLCIKVHEFGTHCLWTYSQRWFIFSCQ